MGRAEKVWASIYLIINLCKRESRRESGESGSNVSTIYRQERQGGAGRAGGGGRRGRPRGQRVTRLHYLNSLAFDVSNRTAICTCASMEAEANPRGPVVGGANLLLEAVVGSEQLVPEPRSQSTSIPIYTSAYLSISSALVLSPPPTPSTSTKSEVPGLPGLCVGRL